MARKSRVNKTEIMPAKIETRVCRAVVYARLSREKEDTMERGTIDNQVDFVRDYISHHDDMEFAGSYVDDDYTGTDFNRPGYERMMSDMKKGLFDLIVVKDLSRLGREYVQTGNLIERVFPMFGVRFIAILDNYDTDKTKDNLMMGVTNIANTLYAQDISKKVYSSIHESMAKGVPMGRIPYGYKAVLGDNGEKIMIADSESGAVVRRIFMLYKEGKKSSEICRSLNDENIPTPYQFENRNRPDKLAKKPHLRWTVDILKHILKNEVYTGRYVIGKTTKCLYKHQGLTKCDKSEWLIFEDHHEAIISKEDFDIVQGMRPTKKATVQKQDNHFRGIIYCGKCGSRMTLQKSGNHAAYVCGRKSSYGVSGCDMPYIHKDFVYETVHKVMNEQIRILLDADKVVRRLNASDKMSVYLDSVNKSIRDTEKRIERLLKMKTSAYQDLTEGLLSETEYRIINEEYDASIREFKQEREALSEKLTDAEATPFDRYSGKEDVLRLQNSKKLSKDLVNAFVDKVIVHGKKSVEVVLKFDDVLKETIRQQERKEGLLNG